MSIATTPSISPAGTAAVVAAPESELAPLLAAWDHAHSTAADDLEWRHLLDEMAHPRTTQAFYRLAAGANAGTSTGTSTGAGTGAGTGN
ncbi:hypothetical protein AB0D14_05025 [Streptomyces sp. NPDC048484]|uniref:hypothetical protein n=1 Tax=Streptomyces sp. NPDC048484 TaxID=3155146 RepID=UPI003444C810